MPFGAFGPPRAHSRCHTVTMPGMASVRRRSALGRLLLLGPAFVAAVAYVDPGNVAANLTGGSTFGYRLLWVLVMASAMAVLAQYLSAKLGIVTGRTLSSLVADSLDRRGRWLRVAFGVQALLVAMATDIAEVVGGALALFLLFRMPLWLGGLVVGLVSLTCLAVLRTRGERTFEVAVTAILALVAIGFLSALLWAPVDQRAALRGLVPGDAGPGAASLAAAMLGATVMPHAIYLHSALAIDRHRPAGRLSRPIGVLLRVQMLDVWSSLVLAGGVNIAMLLFAAAALQGSRIDTIEQAYRLIGDQVGRWPALIFALGLLASGIGSSIVGTHAGARIARDLLPWHMDHVVRRALTIVPAVGLLLAGINPTKALVNSQIVLSLGIAFALVPLVVMTGNARVMGIWRNRRPFQALAWTVVALLVALNLWLLTG